MTKDKKKTEPEILLPQITIDSKDGDDNYEEGPFPRMHLHDEMDIDLLTGKRKVFSADANRYRQAFLRVILLPFYCQWWASETSCFAFLMTTSLYFIQLLSICLYFLAPIDWSSVYKSEVLMPAILMILYSAVYGRLTAPTLGSKQGQEDDDEISNDYMNTPRLQDNLIDSDCEDDLNNSNNNDNNNSMKKSSLMSTLFRSFTNTKGTRIDRVYNKTRRSIANRVHEQNRQLTQINAYILHKGKLIKTPITLLDILEIFEKRASAMKISPKYTMLAIICSSAMALLAPIYRIIISYHENDEYLNIRELSTIAFGTNLKRFIVIVSLTSTWVMSLLILMYYTYVELLFRITEFKGKCFDSIMSLRKAKKYKIPYFRLHNVKNIQMWLSIRSMIKRGINAAIGQAIISSSIMFLIIISCFVMAPLVIDDYKLLPSNRLEYWYLVIISISLGLYVLQATTLRSQINLRLKAKSCLYAEQMHVQVRILTNPDKKTTYSVVANVLKVALQVVKESDEFDSNLQFSSNPLLSTVLKVIFVSAVSSALSEVFGFHLKLSKLAFGKAF